MEKRDHRNKSLYLKRVSRSRDVKKFTMSNLKTLSNINQLCQDFHYIHSIITFLKQLYLTDLGLPGVIKTKTGLDKFYGNFFIKNILI